MINFNAFKTCNGYLGLVISMTPGLTGLGSGRKVIGGGAPEKSEDLKYLMDLMAVGKIKAVIDRTFPLQEVAAAHKYVDSGRKKGNVVITVVK